MGEAKKLSEAKTCVMTGDFKKFHDIVNKKIMELSDPISSNIKLFENAIHDYAVQLSLLSGMQTIVDEHTKRMALESLDKAIEALKRMEKLTKALSENELKLE